MNDLRLDDLEIGQYKIYQKEDMFCFGIDSVLLSNFALRNIEESKKNIKIFDICSGNIPIPLIMYAKNGNNILGIKCMDINNESCDIAKKSIEYNFTFDKRIKEVIEVICDNIKNILNEKYKNEYDSYDIVTCNPPYMKNNSALKNEFYAKMIARHEIMCNFDDISKVASKLLKTKGKFFIVHKTNRLIEIIKTLDKYKLEPKKLQFIHSYETKVSNLFLLEAVKNAKAEMKVLEPIIIYKNNREYTEKVLKIYGK